MDHKRWIAASIEDVVRGNLDRRSLLRLSLSLTALTGPRRKPAGATAAQDQLLPPDAPARPEIFALPGGIGVDLYAWLEDPADPDVMAYLKAENAYTEAVLAPTRDLQAALYREMTGRFKRSDHNVPTPWRGFLYYQRTEEGKDYDIICRRRGSMDVPEQLLLDLNAIGGDFLNVAVWRPSPDNQYLAFNLDQTGAELYTLYVLNMATGQIVAQLPPSMDAEWAQDSRTLYYCRQDERHRPYQLNRHTIGSDLAADTVLYEEDDERFWLRVYTCKDRSYHVLESRSIDTTEVSVVPGDLPDAGLTPVVRRDLGVHCLLEHHGDEFLLLTDEDTPNFRLMAAPAADPARANWREIVPHRPEILLTDVEPFARHVVLYGRENGFRQVWIHDLSRGLTAPVRFGEAVYTVGRPDRVTGGENWEFDATKVRLAYSSPVTPDSVYEVDLETGKRTLLKRMTVRRHDPSRYVTERLFATAADGAQIPISLVSLRQPPAGLPAGPRPMRLDAYGGYGVSLDPAFSIYRLALIDRGVSFAIAHVRGGAELGQRWWKEGRRLEKKTTFSDFITCAEHLIAQGRTAPDRLAIHGGSVGGLLVAVVANERPDLFQAVVAEVPGVDIIGILLRSSIGPVNQDEFGDPNDPTEYDYLLSYSAYQNVRAQAYPAMFVTGALHDTRTPYWVPAKWVARLRDVNTGDNPILLHMGLGSGHVSVTAFSGLGRELALWYAFVLEALGLADVQPAAAAGANATPSSAKRQARRRRQR